jgi:Uncharacterized component of anaerobic dehydrogenases
MTIQESLAKAEELRRSPTSDGVEAVAEEEQCRAGTWNLLATLLWRVPDRETLRQVATLSDIDGSGPELQAALAVLGLAASTTSVEAVDDEFHDLFIGMGRGELLPYGSWYQTGFLMERPLSVLRDDLAALGYQRSENVKEPEDHVAALCEVMALLIQEGRPPQVQATFFRDHMEGWIVRFFEDLSNAKAAVFYRSVGRLGKVFTEFERDYLFMQ